MIDASKSFNSGPVVIVDLILAIFLSHACLPFGPAQQPFNKGRHLRTYRPPVVLADAQLSGSIGAKDVVTL
jgi:hypothetical protein